LLAMRRTVFATLLLVLSACSGRPADQPALGIVSGQVRLDGQPLADATIFFSPEGGGRTSVGRTDAEGRYALNYVGQEEGAKVGKHVVRVTTSQEVANPKTGRSMHTAEKVPRQYNDKSELTRDVAEGANKIDLELTSAGPKK